MPGSCEAVRALVGVELELELELLLSCLSFSQLQAIAGSEGMTRVRRIFPAPTLNFRHSDKASASSKLPGLPALSRLLAHPVEDVLLFTAAGHCHGLLSSLLMILV